MNIYKISQTKAFSYDTYDSAVVLAETEEQARRIHPGGTSYQNEDGLRWWEAQDDHVSWIPVLESVEVFYLGKYTGRPLASNIICASFNAG